MSSQKTAVIDYLFHKYWSEEKQELEKTTMSMADVSEAIQVCNERFGSTLRRNNPANFMKDIVRGQNASSIWPKSVTARRYTAIQRTGAGDVFEFLPFKNDQTEPFPDKYRPTDATPRFYVQSISLPLATKTLGRSDEPWLIQTAVNLRVIETHFAVNSDQPILEISHLQMSVKLRQTEIDSLFLGILGDAVNQRRAIITCEAKQARERILEHQIINQIQAAFDEIQVDTVIAIGLRAIKDVGFYLAEFAPVRREDADALKELTLAKEAIYELKPPVQGI